MEYIVWFAVVSGLLLLCGIGLCMCRTEEPLFKPSDKAAERQKMENELRLKALSHVPTPWGWPGSPGNGQGAHTNGTHAAGSLTIHRWVDSLVAEKQSIQDSDYLRRREASLRALLEDRFHSSRHMVEARIGTASESSSASTARSGSSDAQAESFGQSHLNGAKPTRVNGHAKARSARNTRLSHEPISTVRTPWGW